ncbi:hypothetical protein ACNOYE_28960 [Nannocystaceae bacterium ST9]
MYRIVSRGPLRATRRQVHELRAGLPELARLDIDLLELALDMIPVCVLARRPRGEAEAIVRELAEHGVELDALTLAGLERMLLGRPRRPDALAEAVFVPAFMPALVIRATPADRSGIELALWTARESPDSQTLAERMSHGLDLEHFRDAEVLEVHGRLDERSAAPLLDALAALRQSRDPERETPDHRDGMDVELELHDEQGRPLHLECWSPTPDDHPRLHAVLLALIDACARLPLDPTLARRVHELRRYL